MVHKYPYPYNDSGIASLLEKTTNATFPRASLPNAFFPEKRQIDLFLGTGEDALRVPVVGLSRTSYWATGIE